MQRWVALFIGLGIAVPAIHALVIPSGLGDGARLVLGIVALCGIAIIDRWSPFGFGREGPYGKTER